LVYPIRCVTFKGNKGTGPLFIGGFLFKPDLFNPNKGTEKVTYNCNLGSEHIANRNRGYFLLIGCFLVTAELYRGDIPLLENTPVPLLVRLLALEI
jgi:hypothetical protein